MDWPYIAGFFDGEGCISITRVSVKGMRPRLQITQAEPGAIVLEEILRFLKMNGVEGARTYRVPRRFPHHKDKKVLMVQYMSGVGTMLTGMLPYLRVKRQKALEALSVCRVKAIIRPVNYEEHKPGLIVSLMALHLSGVSAERAARHLGINGWTARQALKRHGVYTWMHNSPKGEMHHNARISAKQVAAIRASAQAGTLYQVIARRYGMSVSNVGKIVRGEAWAHGKATVAVRLLTLAPAQSRYVTR